MGIGKEKSARENASEHHWTCFWNWNLSHTSWLIMDMAGVKHSSHYCLSQHFNSPRFEDIFCLFLFWRHFTLSLFLTHIFLICSSQALLPLTLWSSPKKSDIMWTAWKKAATIQTHACGTMNGAIFLLPDAGVPADTQQIICSGFSDTSQLFL